MDKQIARTEPFDPGLEQAVLGSLIADNALIDAAAADLEAEHFGEPLHQRIYDVILVLRGEGSVNPVILNAVMKSDKGLQDLGGVAYLANLALGAPALPRIEDYVRHLKELALRRAVLAVGGQIADQVAEGASAREVADSATEALLQVGRASGEIIIPAYELAMASLQEAEDIQNGKPVPMVKTGLEKVDAEIGGLRGGDLIVIAGKSGMGKSALMGGLGLNTSAAGIPTLVFSIEMMRRQWVERMVCDIDFSTAEKAMWYSRVRNGRLTPDEFRRYALAAQKLDGLPFEIHETMQTVQQISSRSRAFKAKHGGRLGIVIVDYIQKVTPAPGRDRNREQEVNAIASGLKDLAKTLGWPVIAGSQLNEGDTKRAKDEQRPQASDVRESKGVMNEADLMLLPYRPAYYVMKRQPVDSLPGSDEDLKWKRELRDCRNRFELIAGKNRHGREFNLELFCEMGASAIRDTQPMDNLTAAEEAQQDMAFS